MYMMKHIKQCTRGFINVSFKGFRRHIDGMIKMNKELIMPAY